MLILLSAAVGAQEPPASPLVRGVVVERDTQTSNGQFSVRATDNQVFRYRFDPKTYVERDERMIDAARLEPGDKVEVLSDEGPGSSLRYARTVHVLEPPPAPPRPVSQGRYRVYRTSKERQPLTGTLTLSGVVSRTTAGRLMLHTREGGDQTILLRDDTRYLSNGEIVEASDLKPNMRVFVRAGKNLYNETEAYQIIWGQILLP